MSDVDSESVSAEDRYSTLLHIQWAFALSCAYLLLFNEQAEWTVSGALLIVGLFVVNLVLGRLGPSSLTSTGFTFALALIDIVLVTACLYVADQLTVQIVLLCIGVLVLSIAGLKVGTIAVVTLVMMAIYLFSVWATGSEDFLKSSVLLRVPLLFTSAFVFAWLVEAGSSSSRKFEGGISTPSGELEEQLEDQLAAIHRCREALQEGSVESAETALAEIEGYTRSVQSQARAILG